MKKGIAIVALIIVAVATTGACYLITRGVERTEVGFPLYSGASKVQVPAEKLGEMSAGITTEAYDINAAKDEVSSWTEARMSDEGWEKEWSERAGEVWFSRWRKGDRGVTIVIGQGDVIGKALEVNFRGNALIFLSGNWSTVYESDFKPIVAPALVVTSPATGVGSNLATLNMSISYGNYSSADIRFRWRVAGGSWNYTTWENDYTYSNYNCALSGLNPDTTYEFEAQVWFNGKEDFGGVKDFTTTAAPTQPQLPFYGTFTIENAKEGNTVIVIKHMGGEACYTAYDYDNTGTDNWRNLEVRVNGVKVSGDFIEGNPIEAGVALTASKTGVGMVVGDQIRVKLASALAVDDMIVLIYNGGDQPQVLMELTIV